MGNENYLDVDFKLEEDSLHSVLLGLKWKPGINDGPGGNNKIYFVAFYKDYVFSLYEEYMTLYNSLNKVTDKIFTSLYLYGSVYENYMPLIQKEYVEKLCSIFKLNME